MPLFSKGPKDKVILILDVQSSLVRGSLVRMAAGGVPEIFFAASSPIPHKERANSSYLIKTALKALGQVVDACLRQARPIAEVHYVLSSPWILSQAKAVSSSLEEETPVTRARIMGMLADERGRLTADGDQFEILEEKILDVRLNGYSVPEWQGKNASELGISYVTSIAGTLMLKRFREACERAAPARRVFFHSSLLLQHIGIRIAMPERSDYALIHVHAELTDIAIIERGSCVFFGSYPMGSDGIVRMIARATKTDPRAAESLLTLYSSQALDEAHERSLRPVMQNAADAWTAQLRSLFKEGSFSGALPEETILSARSHEGFFADCFRAAYPRARVALLSEGSLSAHASFASGVERARLTEIYAMAVHSIAGR